MTLYNSNPNQLVSNRPWCEIWLAWSLTFGVNYFATPDARLIGFHCGPLGIIAGWPRRV